MKLQAEYKVFKKKLVFKRNGGAPFMLWAPVENGWIFLKYEDRHSV